MEFQECKNKCIICDNHTKSRRPHFPEWRKENYATPDATAELLAWCGMHWWKMWCSREIISTARQLFCIYIRALVKILRRENVMNIKINTAALRAALFSQRCFSFNARSRLPCCFHFARRGRRHFETQFQPLCGCAKPSLAFSADAKAFYSGRT